MTHRAECPATECGCEQGEECGPTCIHTCQCALIELVLADAKERGQEFIRRNVYAKPWRGSTDALVQGVLAAVRGTKEASDE